jgi:hypothetical protein
MAVETQTSEEGVQIRTRRSVLFELPVTKGTLLLDGNATPFADGDQVLIPAGAHSLKVSKTAARPLIGVMRLNADLRAWTSTRTSVRFTYSSRARAIAVLNRRPRTDRLDGQKFSAPLLSRYGKHALLLPHGTHEVVI